MAEEESAGPIPAFKGRATINDTFDTLRKNYRAYAFYTNYGFRVTDWTYGWVLKNRKTYRGEHGGSTSVDI